LEGRNDGVVGLDGSPKFVKKENQHFSKQSEEEKKKKGEAREGVNTLPSVKKYGEGEGLRGDGVSGRGYKGIYIKGLDARTRFSL